MLVKNISQELRSEVSKRNWFSYWKHFKTNKEVYCSEINCLAKAEFGALVKKSSLDDESIFVIGLCTCHGKNIDQTHNHIIDLSPDAELINFNLTL
jgi:hypothetical protein